ncbi:uncharacterized protein F21D5.5-like isoform X2 [Artemia franciscana]|uniref:uncharacterized protein F21D5.5-like isoform X2 n=1 Tax=Artemia franciscana TaxID=6661 RepID=UPI0032DAE591
MKYKFVLNPLNFLDYKPIQLEPGNISLIKIGRGELTKIKDSKLSRDQIEFSCNYDDGKAQVTVTGGHPSIVNGLPLKTGETVQMSNGDSLELLENKYKYKLLVKPYTEAETNKGESIKRKLSDISLTDDKSPGRKRSEKEVENEDKEGAIKRTLSGTDIDHEKGSNAKRQETGLSETARGVQPRGISSFLEGKIIAADSSWESVDDGKLLIFTEKGAVPSSKIAAFDLDGTIITTMSGLRFPRDASDWKILFPEIPKKLKSLISCGFKIVIITNQAGISGGKYKVGDLKKKMHNILKKLGVPAQIFVATGKTRYRKPSPSIWTIISHELNNNIEVDMDESFFCGDAAGRPDHWAPKKKKDHSIADRLFALNVGLKFYTPEEYFLGQKSVQYKMPEFDPRSVRSTMELLDPPTAKIAADTQEVIVMVGAQGSGKSHFVKKHLIPKGYKWINRDTLKDWKKCVKEMQKGLESGSSVVIDNTSPDKESRAKYISAVGGRCPVRCFLMNTAVKHAQHNIKVKVH